MGEQNPSRVAPPNGDPDLPRRQQLLNLVLLGLAGPGLIFGIVMAVLWTTDMAPSAGALAGLGVQPFYLLAYWLGRRGRVRLAALVPVTVLFLIMTWASWQFGIGHVTMIGYAMVATTAGILIGTFPALAFTLLSVGAYVAVGLIQQAGQLPGAITPEEMIAVDGIGLGLGLVVLVIFNWLSKRELSRSLRRERDLTTALRQHQAELETQVAQRTADLSSRTLQIETAAQIARDIVAIHDVDELLEHAVRLISEQFDLYHVGIYLLDPEGTRAVLRVASSEQGQQMVAGGHQVKVGGSDRVGFVAATGQSRLADDLALQTSGAPHFASSRARVTVPLTFRERTLGVLDAHSDHVETFTQEDVAVLQTMADQLAIGLENARLLTEAQTSIQELQQTFQAATEQAWQTFGGTHGSLSHYQGDPQRLSDPNWRELLERSRSLGKSLTVHVQSADNDQGQYLLAVPIRLRGVPIGATGFHRPAEEGEWKPEEITLAERMADRLALSLENIRLLQETRQRASYEQLVGQITTQLRASLDPDTVLQTTVRELGRALGAQLASIEITGPAEGPSTADEEGR